MATKTKERPLEIQKHEKIDWKAIQVDFIKTTMQNIAYHTLQLTFARHWSAEERYHLDGIANERNSLKNYGN